MPFGEGSEVAATDWAMVNNGQFEYRDVDGEVALEMTSIDISDLINISFSIDISGAGGLETSDYVNVYYAVDGGAFTLIQNWNNLGDTSHTILGDIGGTDFTSTTLTQSIAPASSLIVKIVAINGAGSEYFRLDNFTLEGVSSSCSANLAEGVATCNDNTPNMDTYNATFNFTNGTETDAFTVVASSGTPDVTMISADGTITVSGVNEGDNLTLTLTNENCSFEKTVISPVCEPTVNTCFDLSNGSELFEMTSVLTNDDDDQWTESAGTYSINGYCNGCTETTTDAWLIFGPLDVTATSNLNLALTATEQYSETDLTINYTSAYTNCPADTAWTLAETITDASTNEAVIDELTLDEGQIYSYTFSATAGDNLMASLCWTDMPGARVANGSLNNQQPRLINDLDLRITKDGTTYFPWKLDYDPSSGFSNSKADNSVDNIERVDFTAPTSGVYTLTVTHKGILQGNSGLPFNQSQDYALILTGNNLALSTQDNKVLSGLQLYPNPSKGKFTVSFNAVSNNDVKITVYDVSGKKLYNKNYNGLKVNFIIEKINVKF